MELSFRDLEMFDLFASQVELSPRCEELSHLEPASFGLALFLLLGMVISYTFQMYDMGRDGQTEGMAHHFVTLGMVSSVYSFVNVLLQAQTIEDEGCCSVLSPLSCFAGLLGVLQIGAQVTCFLVITCLFLYLPHTKPGVTLQSDAPLSPSTAEEIDKREKNNVYVLTTSNIASIVLVTALVLVSNANLQAWADVLGLCSSVIALIQYIPQVFETYKQKKMGALSIKMVLMQCPGSYLLAYSLQLRLGWSGWSTWMMFCISGSLQLVIMLIALYYHVFPPSELDDLASRPSRTRSGAKQAYIMHLGRLYDHKYYWVFVHCVLFTVVHLAAFIIAERLHKDLDSPPGGMFLW